MRARDSPFPFRNSPTARGGRRRANRRRSCCNPPSVAAILHVRERCIYMLLAHASATFTPAHPGQRTHSTALATRTSADASPASPPKTRRQRAQGRGPMVQNCIHIRAGTGDRALGPLRTGCAGIAAGRPALSAAILTQLVADSRRRHAIAARARRTLYHAVHLHHNPPPGPTAQPGSWLTFPAAGCCGGLANLDKFHS